MQNFQNIPETQTLASSREMLLNNEKTIMSLHSGTVFPTANLEVGMLCYRTDHAAIYQLTSTGPSVWKLLLRVGNKVPFQHDQTLTGDGNLNNYIIAGSYAIPKTGLSNHPGGSATISDDQILVVYERDISVIQILHSTGGTTPTTWVRSGVGSTKVWTGWSKVWHAGNDGAASGLDADLLDGQQGSYYAPINDANLTGNARAPNKAAGENSTAIANTAFVQTAVSDKFKKTGDTFTGTMKYSGASGYIQKLVADTVATADTMMIAIAGGGDDIIARGAFIRAYGSNHATLPGRLTLSPGTGGEVRILASDGNDAAAFTVNGVWTHRGDSTVSNTGFKLANGDDLGTLLGSVPVIRYYTATGASTWTKSANLKGVLVEVQAGGGNGSGLTGSTIGGGGGGGGGYSRKYIPAASLGSTETVTVGGVAGASSFGAHCSATGGASAATNSGQGGAGGSGAGGDLNIAGGAGGNGSWGSFTYETTTHYAYSGAGGGSYLGVGGTANGTTTSGSSHGRPAVGWGAGGSGGVRAGAATTGGAGGGGQGIVIVTEFY